MNSSLVRQTNRRPFHRSWATALSLVTVLVLAACGTTDVGLPTVEDDDPAPATQPSIATFVAEAQSFAADGAFEVGYDDAASSGAFLVQPAMITASSSGAAVVEIAFDIASAGEHTLWARMRAESLDGDATYLGFDGTTNRAFAPELGRYVWREIVREDLARGPHVISLGYGEPGLRIDLLVVTSRRNVTIEALEALVVEVPIVADPSDPTATEPAPSDPVPSDPEPSDPAPTDPAPTKPEPIDPKPSDPVPAPPVAPTTRAAMTLVGDEAFTRSSLTSEQRLWYDRTWSGIENSSDYFVGVASRDNSYRYGRDVYQYNHALLMDLRSTGDLRFLDEVDRVAEAMRSQLRDDWSDGIATSLYVNSRYGTVSEPDGYVNFRWVDGSTHRNNGRDVGDLDEALTHGNLAMVMYAYHANRDLQSPAGINYGERADFWFDYLRNDFEAKWRERSRTAWPSMDFIDTKFGHTYGLFNLYYYFMGKKLQDDGNADAAPYLAKAEAMTVAMFEQPYVPGERAGGFVQTSGPTGDAVIYSFGAPGNGTLDADSVHLEALPMTYARYLLSAVVMLRAENFSRWDDAIMMRLANGLTSYVLDTPSITSTSNTFAAGTSGSTVVANMPPTEYRSRITVGKYGTTFLPALAVWDASGRIEKISLQVYDVLQSNEERPTDVFIPSSMLYVASATANDLGLTASR